MSVNPNEFKCGCSKNDYREKLAKCEDWEVNKKKKLEEIIASDKCPENCKPSSEDGKCHTECTKFAGKYFSYCPTHNDPTKGKVVVINSQISVGSEKILDERPCNVCQNKDNPNREREREREQNQSQMQQLRTEIQNLEQMSNRTTEQEQELVNKKNKLKELESNSQNNPTQSDKTNYLPYIFGGIGIVAVIGIGAYFLTRKNNRE